MTDFYLDYRGSDYNGGGYDSTITGATVNLASGQYAALTASGLECTAGSTTVTSVYGGFTSDMIGNYINIYDGYEYTFHCYAISGVPNSTTLELASSPSPSLDAVSGVGKIGGAWRTCDNFGTGQGAVGWSGKTRVPQAGDTVNIKGNGQQNPASGQYTGVAYITIAGGGNDNPVHYKGYNGRPSFVPIRSNLFWHSSPIAIVENIKFFGGAGGWETQLAQLNGALDIINCIFDQHGTRARAFDGRNVTRNYVYNSKIDETTKGGNHKIIRSKEFVHICEHNVIENVVGTAIEVDRSTAIHNVINNVYGTGLFLTDAGSHATQARYNTINNCTENGLVRAGQGNNTAIGNLITNCSGYAVVETNSNYADDVRISRQLDYNFLYNNSGNYSGFSGGDNDVFLTANPYLLEASGDLTLNNTAGGGKECRGGITISTAGYGKSASFRDAGALQAYNK